jgi:dTDP-4-amino-4,6-dideoxygalactose transaminase
VIEHVPFFSHNGLPNVVIDRIKEEISRIIAEESLIDGDSCRAFEKDFADYFGSGYCVGVGNGLDALTYSLRALNIGPGDKVAVPSHTFIATWLSVLHVGATPVGIDVNELGQMDLNELENHTGLRCVIPVHMHGFSVDMNRLMTWAKEKDIFVVEDCSQAHGLSIEGRLVGTWGDVGAFSFYPTKNLFAFGDAGAVLSANQQIINSVRSLTRYGTKLGNKYVHEIVGFNSRLDTIQAGIVRIGLEHLDTWNRHRNTIAEKYRHNLSSSIRILGELNTPGVYHHFIVFSKKRQELVSELNSLGIQTEVHYPRLASFELDESSKGRFPNAELFAEEGISLPISPWQTERQTERVIEALNLKYRG